MQAWGPETPLPLKAKGYCQVLFFSKPSFVQVCENIKTSETKDDMTSPGPSTQHDLVVVAGLWLEHLAVEL